MMATQKTYGTDVFKHRWASLQWDSATASHRDPGGCLRCGMDLNTADKYGTCPGRKITVFGCTMTRCNCRGTYPTTEDAAKHPRW